MIPNVMRLFVPSDIKSFSLALLLRFLLLLLMLRPGWSSENFCKDQRILIVAPSFGMGLTNQLLTYANGIALGIQIHRYVVLTNFAPEVYIVDTINPSAILDISALNSELVKKENVNVSICSANLHAVASQTTCVKPISSVMDGWCRTLLRFKTRRMEVSTFEYPSELSFVEGYGTFSGQSAMVGTSQALYGSKRLNSNKRHIFSYFKFASAFYDALSSIVLPSRYAAVHLRVEDDWLKLMRQVLKLNLDPDGINLWEYYFLHSYVEYIRTHLPDSETRLLVCTGLLESENRQRLHFGVEYLRKFYKNIFVLPKAKLMKKITDVDPIYPQTSTQLRAVFDLIALSNSDFFIGVNYSSFSNIQRLMGPNSRPKFFFRPEPVPVHTLIATLEKFKVTAAYALMVELNQSVHLQDVKNVII
jgi:hypothetical protein